jgi:tRNA pseudouridine38-40 synthase
MAFYYNLRIEFKGTSYMGWQVQPNVPTVQGEINRALKTVFKSDEIHSTGSGRTDAGVHAKDFLVKISVPFEIALESLVKALNSNLPLDIRVKRAQVTQESFLPTNHAKSKEYNYRFTNLEAANAFQNDYIANISYSLDIKAMQEACKVFIGTHDFSDFQCTGSDVKTTEREITLCELVEVKDEALAGLYPSHYLFRVAGNGFLKQMVRLMMGTLWNVGRGKITVDQIRDALRNPSGEKLGPVAPACGLIKVNVDY